MSNIESVCCVCGKVSKFNIFTGKYEWIKKTPSMFKRHSHTYCDDCYRKEKIKFNIEVKNETNN